MPEAILKFKLPNDVEDFHDALHGWKYRLVIEDVSEYLRKRIKYEELPEDVFKALEDVRRELYERMESSELP